MTTHPLHPSSVDTVNQPAPVRGTGIAEGDYGDDTREVPLPHAPIAGNWDDDDSVYLDERLEQVAPLPVDYAGLDPQVDEIPHPKYRMFSRRIPVAAIGIQFDGVQAYPAQPDRMFVKITADIAVLISGEKNMLNGAARWEPGSATSPNIWEADGYDGEVWVQAADVSPAAAGTVNVWVAVPYADK